MCALFMRLELGSLLPQFELVVQSTIRSLFKLFILAMGSLEGCADLPATDQRDSLELMINAKCVRSHDSG